MFEMLFVLLNICFEILSFYRSIHQIKFVLTYDLSVPVFNTLSASGKFYRLLITFANSLDLSGFDSAWVIQESRIHTYCKVKSSHNVLVATRHSLYVTSFWNVATLHK